MENLKAAFLSEWWDNPYMTLLIDYLNLKGVKVGRYQWRGIIFLPQVIRQGKPDILHLHTLHRFLLGRYEITRLIKLLIFSVQLLILRLIGTKIIWTVHEWNDKFRDGVQTISKTHAVILGKLLDVVITHCDSTKREVDEVFRLEQKNKLFVVPHVNFIDYYENKINPIEARKALNIETENIVFLIFGSLYRYKGILEAIDAFKKLQKDKISLIIAGNPYEGLKEPIEKKISGCKNIIFVPKKILDDEVQIYMNACDWVVIPYRVFTTSGVAVLAMSFERACIAPDAGFFSDVLDESGAILYDSIQEDSLLNAMKQAIEKRNNVLQMGKHNLKLAEQWNWKYVGEETFNFYQKSNGSLKIKNF
jgi:glycosyltransferase involved in cell wall biosynthesis